MSPSNGFARRRGLTLVEILVVIAIMSSLVAVGGGIMSPQISYFSQKAGVEEIAAALRRAQQLARSRGVPPLAPLIYTPTDVVNMPVVFGLAIFRGRYQHDTALAPVARGFSYMVFAQNDPMQGYDPASGGGGGPPIPIGDLGTVPAGWRGYVNPLPIDVHITRAYAPGGALPPQPITDLGPGHVKFVFHANGELDTYLVGGASNTTIAALNRTNTLPIPDTALLLNGGLAAWSFDVVSETAGWMRVRIRPGGSIETSAIVPTTDPPQTRTGLLF
jgi:prepilin-type N-terminal cleavage/methylation domain-containing protein